MSTPTKPPRIILSRSDLLVIDKPAGLAVHAGPGGSTSVEDFFPLYSRRRDGPWLVHRLDADTSGCLVIALRRAALIAAQAEFAAGRARKTYWAITHGKPSARRGIIESKLTKRNTKAGWRMVADPSGQTATTEWELLGEADGMSWLELRPRTGRTHQIRVHCAELGCPLLGDAIYGSGGGPLQLLARSIELDLADPLAANADPPAAMAPLLRRLTPA